MYVCQVWSKLKKKALPTLISASQIHKSNVFWINFVAWVQGVIYKSTICYFLKDTFYPEVCQSEPVKILIQISLQQFSFNIRSITQGWEQTLIKKKWGISAWKEGHPLPQQKIPVFNILYQIQYFFFVNFSHKTNPLKRGKFSSLNTVSSKFVHFMPETYKHLLRQMCRLIISNI